MPPSDIKNKLMVDEETKWIVEKIFSLALLGYGANRKKQEKELKKSEKRKSELDSLFARLYEDFVSERITEYNFQMLSAKYQNEQAELTAPLLNALVEKILVHQAVKHEDGTREQEVEISYRFIGKIE